MKVSIITICFNSSETIEDTIDSVLAQDYTNIEYIIIDGNSTDNTLSILKKYEVKISTLISEPDNGLYDAINKGIKNATGEIIGLVHADDVFANNSIISTIVTTFNSYNCDGIYGDNQYVNQNNPNKIFRNWIAGEYKEGMFLKGWMPPHPTLYLKRNLFEKYGYYNTDFKISADYELMLRFIHKHKIKLKYIPQVLVKMKVGGKSNASIFNRIQANIEDRKAWKINNLKADFLTPYRKPLSKLSQFFRLSRENQ